MMYSSEYTHMNFGTQHILWVNHWQFLVVKLLLDLCHQGIFKILIHCVFLKNVTSICWSQCTLIKHPSIGKETRVCLFWYSSVVELQLSFIQKVKCLPPSVTELKYLLFECNPGTDFSGSILRNKSNNLLQILCFDHFFFCRESYQCNNMNSLQAFN